jgi:histidinol phosphatase-like PHP family hydrolase
MAGDTLRSDFHTHTILSDGILLPIELIRRVTVMGYRAIGITDHVGLSNIEHVVPKIIKDCELAEKNWDIIAIPGIEITHIPPKEIGRVVSLAKKLGAELIVVHGESPIEPVEEGTNLYAVNNPDVSILAHPGFLTTDVAEKARDNNIFLEITSRVGHSYTNGIVAKVGKKVGAKFLVNTDAHIPSDLIDEKKAMDIALGAGLDKKEAKIAVNENPDILLKRLDRL